MYKNVFVERGEDWFTFNMHLWDDNGYRIEEFKNFAFIECPEKDSTHRGTNGEFLKRIDRWGRDTQGLHYSDHNQNNIHIKYLVEKYGTDDTTSKSHIELFFDIEIEMGGELTPEYIKKAPKPLTSIAWWDKQGDQWKLVIVDKENNLQPFTDEEGREVIPVKSEQDLISLFLTEYETISPDILVGFNSDYFDIPYLYYRIKNTMGERYAKRLSPIRIVKEQFWDEDQPIKIAGVTSLDYIRLHKKYHWRDEPSYKLDYLGEKYVDQKKIEYEGSLDRLFATDKFKFIEYNFVDVLILKKLDEKFQYLDLTKNLAHKGKIQYDEVYKSSRIHDGAISAYLLDNNVAPPNKDPNAIEKKNYAGGYLFCPKTGIYEYMFDEDLTSLYPSIIRSLNIGRETLVARIIDPDDRNNRLGLDDLKRLDPELTMLVENNQKQQKQLKISQILSLVENNNLTISANGVMYRTDKKSTLSVVLEKWFNERVEYKNKMKKAFKKDKDPVMGNFWHLRQYTMKILLNSLYGATARPEFRYGNVILAESITLSGQRIIQDSGTFINKKAAKILKPKLPIYEIKTNPTQNLKDCFNVVMYEDTDSCYVHAKPLLDKLYPNFDSLEDQEKTDKLEKLALEYQDAITEYYNVLADSTFNSKDHCLEMKTECVIRSAFFSGKRRYAQYITKKEGVECDEIDIKGLDFMKSNFPTYFSNFFKEILNKVLFGAKKEEITKEILEFRNSMETLNIDKISKPTGVKKIKKYTKHAARSGQIFSIFEKRATVNVKAAVRYNDLIKFKKLNHKHSYIVEGDKIRWVYLKPNPYKIDTLGFLSFDIPEEIQDFIEKYVDKPKAFDTILKNKLESFYKDLNWGNLNLNPTVAKFFTFK